MKYIPAYKQLNIKPKEFDDSILNRPQSKKTFLSKEELEEKLNEARKPDAEWTKYKTDIQEYVDEEQEPSSNKKQDDLEYEDQNMNYQIPSSGYLDNNQDVVNLESKEESCDYIVYNIDEIIFVGNKSGALNTAISCLKDNVDMSNISVYKKIKLAIDFLE
jgi:predicted Holliday junction resolvase-like endonuclease